MIPRDSLCCAQLCLWRAVGLLLMVITMTACAAPDAVQMQQVFGPFVSPLVPSTYATMMQTRWRLVEVTYQGEALAFDAIEPVHVSFEEYEGAGFVNMRSPRCPVGGYEIALEEQQRYRIVTQGVFAILCSEPVSTQVSNVFNALGATTSYEIQNDHLILTGEEARLVLQADHEN